ncbi:MAG: hypothetical protein DMG90_15560 [Acidobacteria bacterium]|nr:MAG: hypothetical protein DMG90_15560 [Acidobacteriota bacterium]
MSSPQLPAVTGELRFHELQSAVFRNARLLRVWVPPGYDNAENGEHRFPVLYLNDGQNLFQAETSYRSGRRTKLRTASYERAKFRH